MKKKIGILGSTGSIGMTTLKLMNTNNFEIYFLTANTNFRKILNQAKTFKVKNIIIFDYDSFKKSQLINKNKNINIYNDFNFLKKNLKKKLDYVISSISGINGLMPTYNIIKYTKKIGIANKESLICAWPIIYKELIKNKTEFIPVDSEHFSIWTEIKNISPKRIKKIYLTASGGPLLNLKKFFLNKVDIKTILKHPTWKMGKKISVDSATMMNKCFEVMEAKNIFNLDYNKIDIIIHPKSYIHAIVVYQNGIIKVIIHDTTMKIPIFNSIHSNNEIYTKAKNLNLDIMNHLDLQKITSNKFPITSVLNNIPNKHSMFETVLVTINDCVVDKFLKGKISFKKISSLVLKFIKHNSLNKYKKIFPKNIQQIISLNNEIDKKFSKIIDEKFK